MSILYCSLDLVTPKYFQMKDDVQCANLQLIYLQLSRRDIHFPTIIYHYLIQLFLFYISLFCMIYIMFSTFYASNVI